MTPDDLSRLSGLLGLGFFIVLFAGVVAFALWPGNRDRFRKAARAPLDEDPDVSPHREGGRP